MLPFRHFLLLLCGYLLAALPFGAYSQFRPVEVVPARQVPQSLPSPAAPEPGTDADRFYDANNPDRHKLQQAEEARSSLPLDKRGAIDWMKALRSGAINPRADLTGTKAPEVLDLDIILKNTKEMPYVKFPHNSHTQWLACSNCHDKIFVPKAGANPISMDKIFRGEYCGACHGRVAFITHFSCERCHSVPHGNVKAWW
ncbi:MAG: c(7)-type cytochrome triheme domain-containing protein [Bacillota bacterium]